MKNTEHKSVREVEQSINWIIFFFSQMDARIDQTTFTFKVGPSSLHLGYIIEFDWVKELTVVGNDPETCQEGSIDGHKHLTISWNESKIYLQEKVFEILEEIVKTEVRLKPILGKDFFKLLNVG